MSDEKKTIVAGLISDLKRQGDQLRVQVHLGSQELKDEWEKLDDKLSQLNHRFDPLKAAIEDTGEEVWESLKLLGDEIKEGFNRIRKSL